MGGGNAAGEGEGEGELGGEAGDQGLAEGDDEGEEGGAGDEGEAGGTGGEGEGGDPDCVPSREICDGRDNDCNGRVDEDDPDLGDSCDTGERGPCWQGRRRCVEGALACVAVVDAVDEACDGIDNDCDGEADEGRPESNEQCDAEVPGACGFGLTRCEDGFLWCDGLDPSDEQCDGLDNDCDGSVDESVGDALLPEVGEPCQTGGVGICGRGALDCEEGELVCGQLDQPAAEQCDGLDNDCDGEADERGANEPDCPPAEPAQFDHTGQVQVWEVPASAIYTIEAWGAAGGTGPGTSPDRDGAGGQGGRAWGDYELQAGEELRIFVGGEGQRGPGAGGFNGGGACGQYGGCGGGASDVRRGGADLEDRILVAGGAGGGNGGSPLHGRGGPGGGLQGGDGIAVNQSWQPGRGGGEEAGGAPGSQGAAGALGAGAGNAAYHHSGAGGGRYGGGNAYASGSGGGSSWYGDAIDGTGGTEAGVRAGAGRVEIRPAGMR